MARIVKPKNADITIVSAELTIVAPSFAVNN